MPQGIQFQTVVVPGGQFKLRVELLRSLLVFLPSLTFVFICHSLNSFDDYLSVLALVVYYFRSKQKKQNKTKKQNKHCKSSD